MTCYMFGGQKLTAGSYADVAIALVDFLDDEGSLDIVPSDIAAALICLVNVQKQKQIERKNELLQDSVGVFAKNRRFTTNLYKMFRESKASRKESKHTRVQRKLHNRTKSWIHDCALGESIRANIFEEEAKTSISSHKERNEDIETGIDKQQEAAEESTSVVEVVVSPNQIDGGQLSSEVHTESKLDQETEDVFANYTKSSISSELLRPIGLGRGGEILQRGTCCLLLDALHLDKYVYWVLEHIIGDNACGWKQTAVLKTLGISESDFLYANFSNDVGVNPYIILVDRKWKTILLAIRGTLSMEDMISDVTISPTSLEECGERFGFDGEGEYCHNGILAGAKWVYEDLERHGILDNAMKSQEYAGFKLRIIGHSLGAGIAAMLSLMLRQTFPLLRCLAFSPPGCVFSEKTAEDTKEFICSYVLHNDVVPRLSYVALVNLRNDIIEMIVRIKVPKHMIFEAHLLPWKEREVADLPKKHLYDKDKVPSSKFSQDVSIHRS
ncbi:predicted protein [Thalassiosira pseudonana CCMP1335]|uniref:sn-1-specific diacylglycerol lipase n=1 Tax=Thalassiosira pseudonana TaxID=35128 RepID=B8BYE1_THAPS|nr:predicted protein [Thalassiosira pseudonana CCMP1335]EED94359.1 predicted protein [Thalassiosira pseudonana CCMP1335]